MASRNARIALMVIFKELPPPAIAEKYGINLSRVYQITQTIKKRYGWQEGMHPNVFSRRIATYDDRRHDCAMSYHLDSPVRMYHEIRREEAARNSSWHYEG